MREDTGDFFFLANPQVKNGSWEPLFPVWLLTLPWGAHTLCLSQTQESELLLWPEKI